MSDNDNGSSGNGKDAQGTGHGASEQNVVGTNFADKALAAGSAVLTVVVIAYVGWHIASAPQAPYEPQAEVVGTQTLPNGDVAVRVELQNPYDRGLSQATVESTCTTPPASVSFTNVPADSTITGVLVCPSGTTDPPVSVATWVKE